MKEVHICPSSHAWGLRNSVNQNVIIGQNTPISSLPGQSCDPKSTQMETHADYVGSSIVARTLNRPGFNMPTERIALIPTFYTSMQCHRDANSSGGIYLSNNERMNLFLQSPAIQATLNCDGIDLESMCPLPVSLTNGTVQK